MTKGKAARTAGVCRKSCFVAAVGAAAIVGDWSRAGDDVDMILICVVDDYRIFVDGDDLYLEPWRI